MSEDAGGASAVHLNWQVNQLHYREQTVAEWARMLPDADIDPAGTAQDCADAINDWMDDDPRAEELLLGLASDSTLTQEEIPEGAEAEA